MIYPANKDFPFDKLTLVPSTIVNGNFFTKYLINDKPLYIEPPKCFSKNGIVKTGKRMFCDLIFIRENEPFIQWLEHLETFTQKYIYDNREKWFETPLEMTDIEDSFTQITKSYKSGKNYLIRTNIPVKPPGVCSLKIYDENENNVDPESMNDKTEIKTILEIQGVKCSSKNFQVEIEVKQIMVLNPTDLFEKCVFKTVTAVPAHASASTSAATPPQPVKQVYLESPPEAEKKFFSETAPSARDKINLYDTPPQPPAVVPVAVPPTDESELCEIEFDLEELPESETVKIKSRNDVYYEKYREAKRKAKIARDLALSSYLEAKRIKNTYMLDDIEDSDDDFYKDGEDEDDDDGDDDDDDDDDETEDGEDEGGDQCNKGGEDEDDDDHKNDKTLVSNNI
jgi:hypothetical protein